MLKVSPTKKTNKNKNTWKRWVHRNEYNSRSKAERTGGGLLVATRAGGRDRRGDVMAVPGMIACAGDGDWRL